MAKTINAVTRTATGTGAARRSRSANTVPAIYYGKGIANELLSIPVGEFDSARPKTGETITLVIDGKATEVKVGEIQFNYLKNHVVHVDFLAKN